MSSETMDEYYGVKSNYRIYLKKLTVMQGGMVLTVFSVLIVSYIVSQTFLHAFDSASLFYYSSTLILTVGLPLLGYQLKKAKELDQRVVSSLLEGISLEKRNEHESFFRNAARLYQKECMFVVRLICILGLMGLLLLWANKIPDPPRVPGKGLFPNMVVVCTSMGFLAVYLVIFASEPYRRFLRELRSIVS